LLAASKYATLVGVTIPLVLVIAGLVVMLVGAVLVVHPASSLKAPAAGTPDALPDVGAVVTDIKDLLSIFQQSVRTGLMVMILGLILVCLGIFVEVSDTKSAVKSQQSKPTASAQLR
jgi:uncharacterized membrane protein